MKSKLVSIMLLFIILSLAAANKTELQIPQTLAGVEMTEQQPITTIFTLNVLNELHIIDSHLAFYGDFSYDWRSGDKAAIVFFFQFESKAYLELLKESVDDGVLRGISRAAGSPTILETHDVGDCKIKILYYTSSSFNLVGYAWSKDDTYMGIVATYKEMSDELLNDSCGGLPNVPDLNSSMFVPSFDGRLRYDPWLAAIIQIAIAAVLVAMIQFMKAYRH